MESLKIITDICNCIRNEKLIYVFGDFQLNLLKENIVKTLKTKKQIKFIYINNKKPSIQLQNSVFSKSLIQSDTIYLVDNIESVNKKEIDFFKNFKKKLIESSKSIILISNTYDKRFNFLRRFQLGKLLKSETITEIISFLLHEINREKLILKLSQPKIPLQYIFIMLSYNLPFFYQDNELYHNSNLLLYLSSKLYKCKSKFIINFFAYKFIATKIKRSIKFPPRTKKKKD